MVASSGVAGLPAVSPLLPWPFPFPFPMMLGDDAVSSGVSPPSDIFIDEGCEVWQGGWLSGWVRGRVRERESYWIVYV